jgi:hypothetical protein
MQCQYALANPCQNGSSGNGGGGSAPGTPTPLTNQQLQLLQMEQFTLATHSLPPLTPGEMKSLGCVGRGVGLGALGGAAKALVTLFFGPPGWAVNILGGAAAGGAVGGCCLRGLLSSRTSEGERFMTAARFLKNGWMSGVVTGGAIAYLGTRVAPFKSHFLLAAIAAVGAGALAGIIEVGARKIAQRPR